MLPELWNLFCINTSVNVTLGVSMFSVSYSFNVNMLTVFGLNHWWPTCCDSGLFKWFENLNLSYPIIHCIVFTLPHVTVTFFVLLKCVTWMLVFKACESWCLLGFWSKWKRSQRLSASGGLMKQVLGEAGELYWKMLITCLSFVDLVKE